MVKYLRDGSVSEYSIQKTVVEWLKLNHILHFSIPNEMADNAIKGRRLREIGLKKGASDLFICEAHHKFHGMFLELKSANGKLKPEQRDFFRLVENQKYFTALCFSVDDAISILSWYVSVPYQNKA